MNWLDKMYLKGEKKNQTTRQQIKNNKKYLLTNIILNYTERDNAEDFYAKVNDFQSNGTTKNEMYREIPDYLSYPSIKKKTTLFCIDKFYNNINLNCLESVQLRK